jgi:hypothetical protein
MTIQERLDAIEKAIDEACEKGWTKEYTRLFSQHEELVWIGARDGYDQVCPPNLAKLIG